MTGSNRPLSPHLQIYRPQLTSVLSITHRATGVALAAGTLLFSWWLLAAASGSGSFALVQDVMGSWPGLIVLVGFTWALFYHLCNGIRHLFWDAGRGLEIETAYRSGWVTVAASVGLTVIAWAVGLSV
ncbi:MAG: succinate dehydrogenase, cytochrome b556 subunit [Alphaproteobacteria bacterium]|nr:succinate dehydrogenase, cytochrome b556 subunit [Alphaproteobacteria bacterium]